MCLFKIIVRWFCLIYQISKDRRLIFCREKLPVDHRVKRKLNMFVWVWGRGANCIIQSTSTHGKGLEPPYSPNWYNRIVRVTVKGYSPLSNLGFWQWDRMNTIKFVLACFSYSKSVRLVWFKSMENEREKCCKCRGGVKCLC